MSRPADWFVVTLGGGILAASLVLAVLAGRGLDPIAGVDLCWSRILLHRDCPGCGLTRSFVAIAGGYPGRGFACNPTGPVLFGAILVATALHGARLAGVPLARLGLVDGALAVLVVVTLTAHALRFYAF